MLITILRFKFYKNIVVNIIIEENFIKIINITKQIYKNLLKLWNIFYKTSSNIKTTNFLNLN